MNTEYKLFLTTAEDADMMRSRTFMGDWETMAEGLDILSLLREAVDYYEGLLLDDEEDED